MPAFFLGLKEEIPKSMADNSGHARLNRTDEPATEISISAADLLDAKEQVSSLVAHIAATLGYEIVDLEFLNHRQKTLRLFIEWAESGLGGIGIEDCVRLSHALDLPLEGLKAMDAIFQTGYELEVSSPGIDRPLKMKRDFERFKGRDVRINIFRPLTAVEVEAPEVQSRFAKQKSFVGELCGIQSDEKVLLKVTTENERKKSKGSKKSKSSADIWEIKIPLALISKANLEPDFHLTPLNKEADS